jgi:cation:H+ antiporter
MNEILIIAVIIFLFYILGKAADLVIVNVRNIGEKLGIQIFFLGILLGFLTSMPELFLGINSIIGGVQEVSLGNLMGGIIVLFGLVFGVSIFYNRKIKTNGRIMDFALAFIYMLFPLFLGLDGKIGIIDAFILIAVYVYILYIFYIDQKKHNHFEICLRNKDSDIFKKILHIIIGMILVVAVSSLIMKIFIYFLNGLQVSIFIIGLIVFSLGTNLPELIVAIRSFKRKASDLSTSNIIGSAISNIVIIGVLALFKPFEVQINSSYYALIFFTVLIFTVFLHFYKTDKALTRKEGMVLLLIYFSFLITQFNFLLVS